MLFFVPTGKQPAIGVKHGLIHLVWDRAEDLVLSARRVAEQPERLV